MTLKINLHFLHVKQGQWLNWNNSEYITNAKTLINANVTIEFTGSQGLVNSYEFPIGNSAYVTPNTLFSGNWNGGIPYTLQSPDGPANRINLGNTIYFYCPVYFWDIKNKRVGIGFKNQCQLTAKINTSNGISFCTGGSVIISGEAVGSNAPFTYKWKQGKNQVGISKTLTVLNAGNYTLEVTDKGGCTVSTNVDIIQNPSPNIIINKSGSTDLLTGGSVILSVPSETNQTYQWLKDNVAISGATNNSYKANGAGKFSVIVTANSCSTTSEVVIVNVILANELPNESKNFRVYPNPFESSIQVNFNELLTKKAKLNLISPVGAVLKEWITGQQENSFDIFGLPSGVYILRCEINDKIEAVKLIKN